MDRKWARVDITDQRFGKLVALRWAPKVGRRTRWICICDCGNQTQVVLENLQNGHTTSCGCARHSMHYPKRDLAGKRFGKLLVLEFVGRNGGDSLWSCRCDCGKETTTSGYNIFKGASRSCGCTIRGALLKVNTKHGRTGSAEYRAWAGMHTRCYNKNETAYPYYGGRGIAVCDRWRGDEGFAHFFVDMGERPTKEHSVERRRVNGNYEPDNCYWATRLEQAANKRNTIRVNYGGREMALKNACDAGGWNYATVRRRVLRGMSFEEATSKPVRTNGDHTIAAQARRAGIKAPTVFARLRNGWTLEKALSVPVEV